MLTLYKYDELFQWDVGRILLISAEGEGPSPTQIHFECNGKALVQYPESDGENMIVHIPNVCLQNSHMLIAYEVVGEWATIKRYQFPIRTKSRPDDYVYDEAEVLTWTQLDRRIVAMVEAAEAAEAARAESEATRLQNEAERIEAERLRIAAENIRKSSESQRSSNEAARAAAEETRSAAESGRVASESERSVAEADRQSAEESRETVFTAWRDEHSGIVAQAASAAASASEAAANARASASSAIDANTSAEQAAANAESAALAAAASERSASSSQSTAAISESNAGQSAASAESSAEQAKTARTQADEQAERARSWAVGPSSSETSGTDTNNAKYWATQAAAAAGGGVLSFNARSGYVLPESGDYSAKQITYSNQAIDASNVQSAIDFMIATYGAIYISGTKPGGVTHKDIWLKII